MNNILRRYKCHLVEPCLNDEELELIDYLHNKILNLVFFNSKSEDYSLFDLYFEDDKLLLGYNKATNTLWFSNHLNNQIKYLFQVKYLNNKNLNYIKVDISFRDYEKEITSLFKFLLQNRLNLNIDKIQYLISEQPILENEFIVYRNEKLSKEI